MTTGNINIIIGGDLGPTNSNFDAFKSGNIRDIIEDRLLDLLKSADYRFFNLEVPLADRADPISKDGPCLIAPGETVVGIKSIDPSLLTLANNHILDQGEAGFQNTLSLLNENEIKYVGAGSNLEEAAKHVILDENGWKIGIYGCAENEFSIAAETKPGANPFDPLESLDHIARLKEECHYVIVLFHGGKERYRYPTPNLQKVCRKMISRGADLIVCQHSHCVGSKEDYENGTIIYGQGNFLFDRHNDEFYQTGLLVQVKLDTEIEVDFIPIQKKGNGVGIPETKLGQEILAGFQQRSEAIKDSGFVERQFDKYCTENGQYYLATLAGLGETIRRIDKVLNRPLTRLIYSRKKLNTIQNHFECETHREILLRYIKILKGDKAR